MKYTRQGSGGVGRKQPAGAHDGESSDEEDAPRDSKLEASVQCSEQRPRAVSDVMPDVPGGRTREVSMQDLLDLPSQDLLSRISSILPDDKAPSPGSSPKGKKSVRTGSFDAAEIDIDL